MSDSVGVYNPTTNQFLLRNSLTTGAADETVSFDVCGMRCRPVAGDWNGDGLSGIVLYDLDTERYFLRGSVTTVLPGYTFFFNAIFNSGFEQEPF